MMFEAISMDAAQVASALAAQHPDGRSRYPADRHRQLQRFQKVLEAVLELYHTLLGQGPGTLAQQCVIELQDCL
jgi:hypothetical protein